MKHLTSEKMLRFRLAICLGLLVTEAISQSGKEKDKSTLLSSLSRYETVRGDVRNIDLIQSCTPISFWIFHRHGTRLPGTDEINNIEVLLNVRDAVLENHENGRGTLTQKDLDSLRNWTFDPSIEATPYYLTQSGFNETKRTSLRYKERFQELLNRTYSKENYYFRHSDTERTLETSYAFMNGLFGDDAEYYVEDIVLPIEEDQLTQQSGSCPKLADHYNDPNFNADANKFLKTDEATKALESISRRLGFEDILTTTSIPTIFGACAYDSAWNQETNPVGAWCAALGEDGRTIGEYYWDLVFISYSGYANDVTDKVGCSAPKDLWERFATAKGELDVEDKRQLATALFSHDSVIMAIHSSLGLLRDDPIPNADNYASQSNRKWRTSKIVPFAANIAAILHECKNGRQIEHKVLLLRNEHPWEDIPNCPKGVCSWENFRNFVKPVADACNFNNFC